MYLSLAETIAAYAVQAMKAAKNGPEQNNLAWSYAADANYWAGILNASWKRKTPDEKGGVSENPAAALAKLRHTETYAIREVAVKYWRENIDPNLSAAKAANTLLDVVPLSHKKLAEIISAAKKGKTKE
jgi:predicted Ser/Thr protein kinase